ncbi:NADH-cytochrome b5 reductase [Peniophora sp. CONT]|nr:NADH-cytochrome b5 reductase [Peniophora sp. CONT]
MAVVQHLVFFTSFVSVFAALVFGSRFLGQKLREAGYDISRLILYGLDTPDTPPAHTSKEMAAVLPDFVHDLLKQYGLTAADVQAPLAIFVTLATTFVLYKAFGGSSKRKPVLDPKEWKSFPLVEKIIISPNTAIYRFKLPHPDDVLGLPTGQHISVSAEIDGKEIMRSYTPTSNDDDRGHFDLLVKAYEKGNISRYIGLLKVGDHVRIKGPKGQFNYRAGLSRHIGMIAGGTGITPMVQVARTALRDSSDKTKFSLIYANVNEEDILLKKELDELAAKHPNRFTVYYVLNNPPAGWTGGVGFVSKDQIEKHMPPSSEDIKVLLCGPPPMMTAMKKYLAELNYPAPRTVSKLVDQVFLF